MLRSTDAAARSCAMNYGCWYAIVRSEKTHTLARNECQVLMCHHAVRTDTHAGLQQFFGMQWITDAAARSDAINDGCWYAIVRSEKTHSLARNEFQVLMCHHAVRKDTHAGLQRILRHAMNYGCGSAIGCNEWPLLIRHRAVRKDTHAGPQRIPSADVPSCGQKRHTHTRWPATNSSACNELRMRQCDRMQWRTAADTPSCGQKETHPGLQRNSSACNELRMRYSTRTNPWVLPGKKTHQHANLLPHRIQNNNQTSKIIRFWKASGFVCKPWVFEQSLEKLWFWICEVYIHIYIYKYISLSLSICLSIYLSMSLPIYFSIYLGV